MSFKLFLEALFEEGALVLEALPALAATGRPAVPGLPDQRSEGLVVELALVAALVHPCVDGGLHVAAHRLAVDREHARDLAQTVLPEPQPQDLAP